MTDAVPTRAGGLDAYRHRWTPPQTDGSPTLVLLHGTGGDASGFDALGAALARPRLEGAGRLSLEGDVSELGAARFFRRHEEGIYDMADLTARTAKFDRFLVEAAQAYRFNIGAATGVGYSNGANLLANHAFQHPKRLSRLALFRPLIPFEPPEADLEGLSVLIAAGRRDPISPAAETERLASAYADRGADVALHWGAGGHELAPDAVDAARAFLGAN